MYIGVQDQSSVFDQSIWADRKLYSCTMSLGTQPSLERTLLMTLVYAATPFGAAAPLAAPVAAPFSQDLWWPSGWNHVGSRPPSLPVSDSVTVRSSQLAAQCIEHQYMSA